MENSYVTVINIRLNRKKTSHLLGDNLLLFNEFCSESSVIMSPVNIFAYVKRMLIVYAMICI